MDGTAMAAIGLAYDGLRVRVEGAASHLDWLREFLAPHFAPIDADNCDRRVVLIEDSPRYRAALRRGAAVDGGALDCFALDSSVIRLPRWQTDAGLAVHHAEYEALYTVAGDTAELLSPAGNGAIRTSLMRTVRELAMNHAYASGGLLLHAAAAARGNRAVLVAGESAAGKTTFLLRLLRQGAAFVANDRVLVRCDGGAVRARGMPSVVTLRPGTLDLFPAVRADLLHRRFSQRLTMHEAQHAPATPQPWSDGRYGLSPAQFCALLQVAPRAAAAAAMLLLPRLSREPGPSRLVRLDPDAAAGRLPPALLGAGTWKKTSDLFAAGAAPSPTPAALAELCRRVAAAVPCHECVISLDAGDADDLARQVIDAL
jgi:hypothetical protein